MNKLYLLFFVLMASFGVQNVMAQGVPPPADTIINVSCEEIPEISKMFKMVNLTPYPDMDTTGHFYSSSGFCNSDYWKNGQTWNDLCSLDTLQSKLGNSCNLTVPGADCFMQDSSDDRVVLKIAPKSNTTLYTFSLWYALVKKSTMSSPQDKPNLAQTFVVKLVELGSGSVKTRQSVSLPTNKVDSFFWIKFTLNQKLDAGKKYKLYIFGMDPLYPNEVNTNPPIWETFGFNTSYICGGPNGTCNWDTMPKEIFYDPFEFPCLAVKSFQFKNSCGGSYVVQLDISDRKPPKLVCPKNVTVNLPRGKCEMMYNVPSIVTSDNCSLSNRVQIHTDFIDIDDNGGNIPNITFGNWPVTYTATDVCGNSATCKYFVTVKESGNFNIVCESAINTSLSSGKCVRVYARSFLKSVVDLCCDYTLSVKRVDGSKMGDYVELCCEDVGKTIKVCLQARSKCDTTLVAECFSEITLNDKTFPTITCPGDVTVDCQKLDTSDWSKFGEPKVFSVCLSLSGEIDRVYNLSPMCKTGTIVRTFQVTNVNNGNTATCSQTISIVNTTPFTEADIIWPKDTVLYGCTPNFSPDKTGWIRYAYNGCSKGASYYYEDEIFHPEKTPACPKVLRHWTIIDWCNFNPITGPYWKHTQQIFIMDTVKPVITYCPSDTAVGNLGACKDSVQVNFKPVLATDCKGIFKIINNSQYATSSGADASGKYPNGIHKVTFTVFDSCGNTTTCNTTITVTDKKAPTLSLVPGISTDIQNCPPRGIVAHIILGNFVKSVSDNCCDIKLSFFKDTIVTDLYYPCDSIGWRDITIYAFDCYGNYTFVRTKIEIQDNNNLCPHNFKDTLRVAGSVKRPNGKDVEFLEVNLDQKNMSCTGYYEFDSLAPVTHTVSCFKDDEYLEGVSTQDIVLIQRYILGKNTNLTPYQLIAADVNHDNKISSLDISELRKLILGVIPKFSKNTSWRFVPKVHNFPAGSMDWGFPETLKVGYGFNPGDVLDADFVGIKTGDVNGSANNFGGNTTALSVEDKKFLVELGIPLSIIKKDFGDEEVKRVLAEEGFKCYIANDQIHITIPNDENNQVEISIVSASGRRIFTRLFTYGEAFDLDLSFCDRGMYVVYITSGHQVFQQKIFK